MSDKDKWTREYLGEWSRPVTATEVAMRQATARQDLLPQYAKMDAEMMKYRLYMYRDMFHCRNCGGGTMTYITITHDEVTTSCWCQLPMADSYDT